MNIYIYIYICIYIDIIVTHRHTDIYIYIYTYHTMMMITIILITIQPMGDPARKRRSTSPARRPASWQPSTPWQLRHCDLGSLWMDMIMKSWNPTMKSMKSNHEILKYMESMKIHHENSDERREDDQHIWRWKPGNLQFWIVARPVASWTAGDRRSPWRISWSKGGRENHGIFEALS